MQRSPERFKNDDLESIIDEDSFQTENEFEIQLNITQRLVQKQGVWLPHDLTERDKERRKMARELLLQRKGDTKVDSLR